MRLVPKSGAGLRRRPRAGRQGSSKAKGKPPSKGADAKAPEALEASPKPCKASKSKAFPCQRSPGFFLLYINHEIQGRSRTKREVGWTGVSVFTWYKYHMQLISCFCMGYVLAPAQLEYWAFAKKAYMASPCESYGDFDDFFADQAEKYVEQTFACCEAWSTLWVSTNI